MATAALHNNVLATLAKRSPPEATLASAATERMSALYLPQYVAAMLTVTLATGMGMALV